MPLKTLQYELNNWKGMNRFDSEIDCDPHYWHDLENMDCDEAGVTKKRRGSLATGLTLSGTTNLIFDFQSELGFGTPTDQQRTVIISGPVLNVIKGFNGAGATNEATFSVSESRHYAVSNDVGVAFITNEAGGSLKMLAKIGSTWTYQNADFLAPASAPTLVVGTTTSFTIAGTFQALQSYVDIWGNESPLSTYSNEVYVSTQSVSITPVVSSDPSVSYIKFYLLGPGMTDFQFSGTTSNTSATYSHSMSMAQLESGDVAPYNLQEAPSGKYVTIYEDMLLVGCNLQLPDAVWASDRQFHRQWEGIISRCPSGDGQPIRGFADSFDRKLVLKSDSIFSCEGYEQTTFRTRSYSKQFGAVGQSAIAQADSVAAFFYDDGAYLDTGQKPTEISRIILDYLRLLDYRNLVPISGAPSKLFMSAYKYYRQLFVSTRKDTGVAGENNIILVWNWLMNTWTKYSGHAPSYMAPVQNADNYEYLFGGNNSGNTWMFCPPNYAVNDDHASGVTTSTTISAYAETPWMNLPKLKGVDDWERARTIPRYLEIYASGEPAGGQSIVTLDCGYYTDFVPTAVSTFSATFPAYAPPTVRPQKYVIYFGGSVGTFTWLKWRFEHARLGEHIKIHKLVFGFKAKPSVD